MPTWAKTLSIGIGVFVIIGIYFLVTWYHDRGSRFWQWLSEDFWGRGLWPAGFNIFGASGWAYLLVGLIMAGVAFAIWPGEKYRLDEYGFRTGDVDKVGHSRAARSVVVLAGLLVVLSAPVGYMSLDSVAQAYGPQTRFVVPDLNNVPTNIRRLDGQYIEEGEYIQAWEPRVASATGALTFIARSSESDSGNRLLPDTLSYTYGSQPGWTAIRDGKNKRPLYGVAYWPGEGDVEVCRFSGQNAINKALHGTKGNSLLDEIAGFDKSLFFEEEDMWGYCESAGNPDTVTDDKPVVIIPVKKWDGSGHRAVWYSAGVLVITGTPSGGANIVHITDVQAAQFPGPVYPISLAATQRHETEIMDGWWSKHQHSFGYETTDTFTQAGNSSEYLLRSTVDGRLYWVTPLTARSSDSQLVTAYSLVLADEATFGEVNDLRVYVLAEGDPRRVNLDILDARVTRAILGVEPGFFNEGAQGRIVEFLPVGESTWQVYAELKGQLAYRITVPSDAQISPIVTSIGGLDEAAAQDVNLAQQSESSCASNLTVLSEEQLDECLFEVVDEKRRRQQP